MAKKKIWNWGWILFFCFILLTVIAAGLVFLAASGILGSSASSSGNSGGGGSANSAPKPDIAIQLNDNEEMELYIAYVRGIFDIEIEVKKDNTALKTDTVRAEFGTFTHHNISDITDEGEYTFRTRIIPINDAKLASTWSSEVELQIKTEIINNADYNWGFAPISGLLSWDMIGNADKYDITANGADISHLVCQDQDSGLFYADVGSYFVANKLDVTIQSHSGAVTSINASGSFASISAIIYKAIITLEKKTVYSTDTDYNWEYVHGERRLFWDKTDNAEVYKIKANGDDISDLIREEDGRFYVVLPSKYFPTGAYEIQIAIESYKDAVVTGSDVIEYINTATLVLEQAGKASDTITIWELVGRSLYWNKVPGVTNYGARANGIDISSNVFEYLVSGNPTGKYYVVIPDEFWVPMTIITLLIYTHEDIITIYDENGHIEKIIFTHSSYKRIDIHYFS